MSPPKTLAGKPPSPCTTPPQVRSGEAKEEGTGSRGRKRARVSEGDGRRSEEDGMGSGARGMVLRSGSRLRLGSPVYDKPSRVIPPMDKGGTKGEAGAAAVWKRKFSLDQADAHVYILEEGDPELFSGDAGGKEEEVLCEVKANAQSSWGQKGKRGVKKEGRSPYKEEAIMIIKKDSDAAVKEEGGVEKKMKFSEQEKGKGNENGEVFVRDTRGKNKAMGEEKAKSQCSPRQKGNGGIKKEERSPEKEEAVVIEKDSDGAVKEEAGVTKKMKFGEQEQGKGNENGEVFVRDTRGKNKIVGEEKAKSQCSPGQKGNGGIKKEERSPEKEEAVMIEKDSNGAVKEEAGVAKKIKFGEQEKGKGNGNVELFVRDTRGKNKAVGEEKAKSQCSPVQKGNGEIKKEERSPEKEEAVLIEKDSNGAVKEEASVAKKMKFSEDEKGKGKLVLNETQFVKGNGEIFMGDARGKNKVVFEEKSNAQASPGQKGKTEMDSEGEKVVAKMETEAVVIKKGPDAAVEDDKSMSIKQSVINRKLGDHRRAIHLAPKFAVFKEEETGTEDDEKNDSDSTDKGEGNKDDEDGDWPGPFSTAMKIIKDREENSGKESKVGFNQDKPTIKISWVPSEESKMRRNGKRSPPSLKYMCLSVLCQNSEEIESLEGIPDSIKNILVSLLCSLRRMNTRILSFLFNDSPTEIILTDCSWATEQQFAEIIGASNIAELKVLRLDLCGRSLPDYVLCSSLARSPNCLPYLNKISLRGAYRLSDQGLSAIVSSGPALSSINLCECSLITSAGIKNLADKLSLLKELYLDDCQDVDAMMILPSLKKLIFLEVLSVAGIDTVSDRFVCSLIPVIGANIRELGFARCVKLTSSSLKIIGKNCPQLCIIDLRNLLRLNDSAMAHLANGCQAIQSLKLKQSKFSDEAVAAYLQASGRSLVELSLNSIEEVSQLTALSISSHCRNLQRLDLSFCRKMTNEGLGLIADSCLSLHFLKLFGCTQVTNLFTDGHSNSLVKIAGLNGLSDLGSWDEAHC